MFELKTIAFFAKPASKMPSSSAPQHTAAKLVLWQYGLNGFRLFDSIFAAKTALAAWAFPAILPPEQTT